MATTYGNEERVSAMAMAWRHDGPRGTTAVGTGEQRQRAYPGGGGGEGKTERRPDRAVGTGHRGRDGRRFYGTCAMAGRASPRPANHGVAHGGLTTDRRAPHVRVFFHFSKVL
jgi:hypothetical protein